MEEEIAVLFLFGGGASFLFAISPIGRAIADRIRGRVAGGSGHMDERVRYLQESHDALLDEVEGMRGELADLQERLDFAERLVAKQRPQGLPDGSDV